MDTGINKTQSLAVLKMSDYCVGEFEVLSQDLKIETAIKQHLFFFYNYRKIFTNLKSRATPLSLSLHTATGSCQK